MNTLRSGTDASALCAGQLSNIVFGADSGAAFIDSGGYVSPVPESSSTAALAGPAAALAAWCRRRTA